MYLSFSAIVAAVSVAGSAYSQQIAQDPGRSGVPIELVHLYYDEYPQGILKPSHEKQFRPVGMIVSDDSAHRHRRIVYRAQVLELRSFTRPKQH